MRIAKLRIENYKCFYSLPEIQLTHGFNIIVGQNNVGKTALAEASSLQFSDHPHRSLKTVPRRGTVTNPISRVDITFELGKDELIDLFKTSLPTFFVSLPSKWTAEEGNQSFQEIISVQNIFDCSFQSDNFISANFTKFDHGTTGQAIKYEIKPDDERPQSRGAFSGNFESFALQVARVLKQRIYLFKAERLNIAESEIGVNPNLAPNAVNLPAVLHLLQSSNPTRFQRLVEDITNVFPEIKGVTIPPTENNRTRILVWSIDPKTERDDLAMPLSESGTGIGQVLAMLYVIVNSNYPRTIIIDEPQSFLHPGAIRKFFEILKQHPQHQYVITTHSPTVVTAADPQTLLLLRKQESEGTIETLSTSENQKLRFFLSEIGAKLSDVFGADDILWVEGGTEEECFPLIISRMLKRTLAGTAIVGVTNTGDFESKHSRTIIEIYTRLSQGRGLLPSAIGFIFDREERTEQEQQDLISQSKGTIRFTKRRMYENYLLNPDALASVMSNIEGFREGNITAKEIEQWLADKRWNARYFGEATSSRDRSEDYWIRNVHAAKLFKDMFAELSKNRINFDKIEHGVALTKWLIENSQQDLEEIARLIASVLEKS